MKTIELKTPLNDGETLFICHKGTIMKGVRVSGQLALTNQRLIWEKSGLANAVGLGLLSLAGTDYLSVPVSEKMCIRDRCITGCGGFVNQTISLLSRFTAFGTSTPPC